MNGTSKFKCIITFSALKSEKEAKCQVELFEHYFSLSLSSLTSNKKELIKNLFAPIFSTSNSSLLINYSFIKNIQITSDPTVILIEVFNPVIKSDISFTLTKIENVGLVFTKKLQADSIKRVVTSIQQRIPKETKHLIQNFLLLLSLLKDCLDPQKGDNQQIETILLQAYMTGKNYYEKYTNEYKNNLKIKNCIKKQLNDKLKMLESMISEEEQMKRNLACACFDSLINEFKIRTSLFVEESILLFFQILSVEMNIIDLKTVNKTEVSTNLKTLHENSHHHVQLPTHLQHMRMNTSNSNNSFSNQSNIHSKNLSLLNLSNSKAKSKSNSFVSIQKLNKSCNGLFEPKNIQALAQLTLNEQNISQNDKSKETEGMNIINHIFNDNTTISISTKNTSKKKKKEKERFTYAIHNSKDLLETPKFFSNTNMKYKYNKNAKGVTEKKKEDSTLQSQQAQNDESVSMIEIMKQIEHLSKVHSFVPPTDVFNIFINTSEIIHRSFFELCFDTYLGKIFSYETDKDNLIKIDAMYNYFLCLRGMKNFIFSERNKLYFSSMLFIAEDLK